MVAATKGRVGLAKLNQPANQASRFAVWIAPGGTNIRPSRPPVLGAPTSIPNTSRSPDFDRTSQPFSRPAASHDDAHQIQLFTRIALQFRAYQTITVNVSTLSLGRSHSQSESQSDLPSADRTVFHAPGHFSTFQSQPFQRFRHAANAFRRDHHCQRVSTRPPLPTTSIDACTSIAKDPPSSLHIPHASKHSKLPSGRLDSR
ncbi:hypothetical protein QBC46DRAFT_407753 [Diplogelasinospora grovesii]|uniref:Uncharacterized protein n=1 Tax=Diplogelasinospora grovesii TaxID=303347 RepID=A0AAN6S5U1_9PEZI|nr:hypothetical protein QBC46DRAFT_407753 [Diplogelasinospora grovesii]